MSTTDRELLELAAKAARIEIVPCTCSNEKWPFKHAAGGCQQGHWNPLRNDGDALRLAVKLRIKFRYNEALGQALAWLGGSAELDDNRANIEDFGGDECACARRAIVCAAAEIGMAA